jgi:hypothetical protein
VLYCFHMRDSSQLRITNLCPFVDHGDGDASFPSVIKVQYEQDGR